MSRDRDKEPENISVNYREENEKLYHQLTNKNAEYFTKLQRALLKEDVDQKAVEKRLNRMMQEAIDKQVEGITARRLYGTVTEQAQLLLYGPSEEDGVEEPVELSPDWQLHIDGALLVGGVFAILSGVSEYWSGTEGSSQLGLISMVANFLIGGLVMLAIGKTAPRPGQKNNYWKYFGASIGSIALWAVVAALINIFIPESVNIPIPPIISIPVGVLAIGVKWWFKRRYQIVGGMF